MATSKNKILINFTIDKEVAEDFLEFTKDKFINKSQLIQYLIEKWMEEEKTKNKE